MPSVLNYFTRADKGTSSNAAISTGGVPGILDSEFSNIADQGQNTSGVKCKKDTYGELQKSEITKYANEYGKANAVVKYNGEFPSLTESTVDGWLKRYRSQLGVNVPNSPILFIYLKSLTEIFMHLLSIRKWKVELLTGYCYFNWAH